MKKLICGGLVGLMTLGAFAAANDVLISFSTPGQDKYRDGTTVLDGECYALVWTATGKTFGGVNADGTCGEGSEIVLLAPLAKNGKCPPVVFEIDIDVYNTRNYAAGSFGVYLLDTRVKTEGGVGLAAIKDGVPQVVNNYSTASAAKSGVGGQGNTLAAVAAVDASVAVATEVADPKISSFKIENGKVVITVNGMSDAATYKVLTGTGITGLWNAVDAKAQGDTFKFDSPENGQFFKISGEKNF